LSVLSERRRAQIPGPPSEDQKSIGADSKEEFLTNAATSDVSINDPPKRAEPTPLEVDESADPPSMPQNGQAKSPEPGPSAQQEAPVQSPEAEQFRPGLGPMIKKKSNLDVANTFRKAATAYNTFKPRAGGAGDRLKEKEKSGNEPDGITGVVPAPSLSRLNSSEATKKVSLDLSNEKPDVGPSKPAEEIPQVRISLPESEKSSNVEGQKDTPSEDQRPSSMQKPQEPQRQKRKSGMSLKHFSALDINPSVLDSRTMDIESILSEFGWESDALRTKKVDSLEAEIKREIGRVEVGSWLGHMEQKDERVEAMERMLHRAITECDELEGLLTLYSVELSVSLFGVGFCDAADIPRHLMMT
jgi:hypothetical protein